jgi:uncharacterized OB-fold protein
MAFCNSCGATLNPGMKFCNKCGAPQAAAVAAPGTTPAPSTPVIATAPPPTKGGSSALKIILIVVAVIVGIGILGMVTCGVVLHRAMKNARVSQKGDNVKIETPFGNMETSADPEQTAKDLGVEIYPGAQILKAGTASVTFGSLHTVTANFESSDPVDKICDFYRQKFPRATVSTSDQTHCTIVSGEQTNSTTITVQPSGDSSRLQIVVITKK